MKFRIKTTRVVEANSKEEAVKKLFKVNVKTTGMAKKKSADQILFDKEVEKLKGQHYIKALPTDVERNKEEVERKFRSYIQKNNSVVFLNDPYEGGTIIAFVKSKDELDYVKNFFMDIYDFGGSSLNMDEF